MGVMGLIRKLRAPLLAVFILGACDTTGIVYAKDENGITRAQGNRQEPADVYDEANRHCSQFGKDALLVLVNTKILTRPLTFECR